MTKSAGLELEKKVISIRGKVREDEHALEMRRTLFAHFGEEGKNRVRWTRVSRSTPFDEQQGVVEHLPDIGARLVD